MKNSNLNLIFGLGNPGKKYYQTRHNIGREIINFLVEKNKTSFKHEKKLKSFLAETTINSKKIFLAKADMFMNQSGYPLRLLKDYYKIPCENIWIVHDDVDIAFGKIKLSFERNAAGHHGVESIINHLGTNAFHRIRIGIWNKPFSEKNKDITQKYVMKRFTQEELEKVSEIKKEAANEIETALLN